MSLARNTIQLLEKEIAYARANYPPFNSLHEAYATLLEEVEELWDEIKKKQRDKDRIEREAIQVAAMAVRMIDDLYDS